MAATLVLPPRSIWGLASIYGNTYGLPSVNWNLPLEPQATSSNLCVMTKLVSEPAATQNGLQPAIIVLATANATKNRVAKPDFRIPFSFCPPCGERDIDDETCYIRC